MYSILRAQSFFNFAMAHGESTGTFGAPEFSVLARTLIAAIAPFSPGVALRCSPLTPKSVLYTMRFGSTRRQSEEHDHSRFHAR